MQIEKLKSIYDKLMASYDLQPGYKGSKNTYCNEALRRLFVQIGSPLFPKNELASAQIERMKKDARFRLDTALRAFNHAKNGGIAIAAHYYETHGHVCGVYPSMSMGFSPSWKKKVLYVANVGHENGVLLASEAFIAAKGEPDYFLFEA